MAWRGSRARGLVPGWVVTPGQAGGKCTTQDRKRCPSRRLPPDACRARTPTLSHRIASPDKISPPTSPFAPRTGDQVCGQIIGPHILLTDTTCLGDTSCYPLSQPPRPPLLPRPLLLGGQTRHLPPLLPIIDVSRPLIHHQLLSALLASHWPHLASLLLSSTEAGRTSSSEPQFNLPPG